MNRSVNGYRLASGGIIDRTKSLTFSFEGRTYSGHPGDTLASALLANGVRVVGRSFKYHRPRGIMAAGADEPNALMQIGKGARSTPNIPATEIRLFDGLEARAVNCWPSVDLDFARINDVFSRFLPAGFYYKTFTWPSWHVYEGFIRRAAGLGRAAKLPDPDRYERRFAHCDILIIGSGPAGLAAALAAGESGQRVVLVEQDPFLGGSLKWEGGEIDGVPAVDWVALREDVLRSMGNVQILTGTTATGYFDHNSVTLLEVASEDSATRPAGAPRNRLWDIRAGKVILATGAIERPLIFPGNDRPGVMLANAVRKYLGLYAVRSGKRAVVFTNNDDAYLTAESLHAAGSEISGIVDTRKNVPDHILAIALHLGITVHLGAEIVATHGSPALNAVTIREASGSRHRLECDLLAMSGGASPTVHLFSQSGGQLEYDPAKLMFVPGNAAQFTLCAGAADGAQTLGTSLAGGHRSGRSAAGLPPSPPPVASAERAAPTIAEHWFVEGRGKAFVDMLNDVTRSDIDLSVRENFTSVEHLKRYTTMGMGSDQGRTSNVNGLAILARSTGRSIDETGTTRFRFPYSPIAMGAFAAREHGALQRPMRQLPMHDWHIAHGAEMDDYGWARPAAYLLPGEDRHSAHIREAKAVRRAVGIFDGSPLGKIEVKGPEAGKFLDFIYANTMSTLQTGKVRYGLMLNENGVIIDDGVCARLGEDHFLVGASSAGADRIAEWLEEWLQCEFVDYDVLVAPVTTSWAVVTLTGPNARALIGEVCSDIAFDAVSFPHMSWRAGHVWGAPARVFRVSYTGEMSYEINVPTRDAPAVWDELVRRGASHGLEPIGIDAWNALRMEKGYLHIGADTDGTSTPLNVGWQHVLKRKADFAGKRSLLLPVNQANDLLEFVGLAAENDTPLPIGAHIVASANEGTVSDGFVTSSGTSTVTGAPIALGLVRRGPSRIGEKVRLDHLGTVLTATLCDPVRYDKEGARLNA